MTLLTICSKWRLSKKGGRVAHHWGTPVITTLVAALVLVGALIAFGSYFYARASNAPDAQAEVVTAESGVDYEKNGSALIAAINEAEQKLDNLKRTYASSQGLYNDDLNAFFETWSKQTANNDAIKNETSARLNAMFDAIRTMYETARVNVVTSRATQTDLALSYFQTANKAADAQFARILVLIQDLEANKSKHDVVKRSYDVANASYSHAVSTAHETGQAVVDLETARNKLPVFHDLLVARQTVREGGAGARAALDAQIATSLKHAGQKFFDDVFTNIEGGLYQDPNAVAQWCATRPPFLDNLHFEQIVKSVMYKTQVEVMDELVEMEIV
jgi:hypothetical protein